MLQTKEEQIITLLNESRMFNESRFIEPTKPEIIAPSPEGELMIASLRDQIASLEQQVAVNAATQQSSVDAGASELSTLQASLQSVQTQLASSLSEIESAKQSLHQRDADVAKLQSELKSLSDERDLNQVELSAKTEALETQLNASLQMASQLSDKLILLTDANNRLELERNRVQQQFEAEHQAHKEVSTVYITMHLLTPSCS